MLIKELDASMLEFEGTNNDVEIREGKITNALIETVTGTIISKTVVRSEYSLINGDIKITAGNENLKKSKPNPSMAMSKYHCRKLWVSRV